MDPFTDYKADILCDKVKHYLITTTGKVAATAQPVDIYKALVYSLKEEIMINWSAYNQTIENKKAKQLYFLSMEYLPGKFLHNNITNIGIMPLVHCVLKKLGRTLEELLILESDPGLGNGGLGRLGSCFLDSLATHHYPAVAYGLRYQYGIFEQELWDGVQTERPDCWLLYTNPWEERQDHCAHEVKFAGTTIPVINSHGDSLFDIVDYDLVRALPYDTPILGYNARSRFGVLTLRLWSTKESPRNFELQRYNAGQIDQAAENTTLTDVLYPSDYHDTGKRIRLKQEFLLVSVSIKDIIQRFKEVHKDFSQFADKVQIQINDTHPSLVIAELIRQLTHRHDLPWNQAVEITKSCVNFTNHTILREALEQWNANRLSILLPRQFQIIEKLNYEFCTSIRARYPGDEARVQRMSIIEEGQVRMASLCLYGCHKVNGVAKLHTEILKNFVFKDYYEFFPDKFLAITNGVTQRRWLLLSNPRLAAFISKRIGVEWISKFDQMNGLSAFADDPESQKEFLAIKRENKKDLINFLQTAYKIRGPHGELLETGIQLNIDSLFDVQIKRIHEYKRQLLLLLYIVELYLDFKDNPLSNHVPRTFIFSGKAASGYDVAKQLLQAISCIARTINKDKVVGSKLNVVLLENYNVSKAEMIVPAAELSEQISTAGYEASGTGNMKLAMNGALTIGTEDGANIEMRQAVTDEWWPFKFGASASEILSLQINGYHPYDIYANNPKLKRILDCFTDRTFALNQKEHEVLASIFTRLIDNHSGFVADRFFVLHDYASYVATQAKVEELYRDPMNWAKCAIHNIAKMGYFSSDRAINDYATQVWNLEQCPIDETILDKVREEYSSHDRCRIFIQDPGAAPQ
ncbi:MAG: glycogen/starch/alpha-glucan family phosphorylase [Parachlamydiales bacterium]|nr:glycogen/starch/alpha-glucan family phosphorylase [Parachlamydiales bacterium]